MSKILITTGIYAPEIGGPASYCDTLASRLAKDHEVTVLTYSKVFSYLDDKHKPYKIIRVWEKYPRAIRHIIYFLRAYQLAGKHNIVFALNAVSAGFPAMKAAKWRKKKFFVKIVGDYAWEIAVQSGKTPFLINDFQNQAHKGWVKKLHETQLTVARQADGVIVPSRYLAELITGWGVNSSRVKIIYNGVEFKPSDLSKEEARKKIGIPGTIITTAGRLVSWKGFKMLIKIMPQLLEVHPFFRLVIIGEGPDKMALQAMVKNMGLTNKVFLVGRKSSAEMAIYFAASDVFVLNSGYEGFSHQLLEVMHCRVPVIVSAVGGNKEIIRQGHNGFLVKYNDEFNIIEAIKGLWKLPELQEQFVNEALESVKKYSAQKMYNETIDVILGHTETGIEKNKEEADQDIPDVAEIINKE